MNNGTKSLFTFISCLIVAITLILSFTIYSIIVKGNEDIAKYRTEEIQRIKQSLKDYVDFAYAIIEANHKNAMNKAYLERYYGRPLTNIIDIAENIIKSKNEAVKNGEITLPEAQSQAAAEIKTIRYDNGKGHIWITDTTRPYPKMIMHPISPSLNEQILDDPKYNSAMGKGQNFYSAAVEISQAHGKGFVDYLWPKQTQEGLIPDVPMLAYTQLFSEWNWIIGTSVYVDDAMIDAIEKSKDQIRQMRYHNGVGFFWINTTHLKMIVDPTHPLLEGQSLTNKLKTLFESFVTLCKNQNGSGFKEYKWPKKAVGGITIEAPKLSYVKLYEPLNWIIGSGVYTDSINEAVEERKELVKKQITILSAKIIGIAVLIVLLIGFTSYIINRYLLSRKLVAIEKQQTETAPEIPVKNTETVANVEKSHFTTPIKENKHPEIPALMPTTDAGLLPTTDCIKMVQEITKTLITENRKLLAEAIKQIPNSTDKNNQFEIANQILTNKTIEKIKQRTQTDKSSANGNVISDFNQMVTQNSSDI
jgi:methyl-accepting chemotaxis protein